MKRIVQMGLVGLLTAVVWGTAAAQGQVTVTVTLSGSVEEMLPILQHLRDMGFGDAAEIEVSGGDEAIRMSVHSVMESGEETSEGAVEEAKGPALFNGRFAPATAKGGDVVLLTVEVNDPDNVVDTVSARFRDIPDATLDLFDNGTQGDRTVGDAVWSRRVPVFPQLQTGEHVLEIFAYDVNGQPVAEDEGSPIQAEATFTVTK